MDFLRKLGRFLYPPVESKPEIDGEERLFQLKRFLENYLADNGLKGNYQLIAVTPRNVASGQIESGILGICKIEDGREIPLLNFNYSYNGNGGDFNLEIYSNDIPTEIKPVLAEAYGLIGQTLPSYLKPAIISS